MDFWPLKFLLANSLLLICGTSNKKKRLQCLRLVLIGDLRFDQF